MLSILQQKEAVIYSMV